MKRSIACGVIALVCGIVSTAQADWVNGRWIYPYKHFTTNTVNSRPFTKDAKGCALSDYRVYGLDRDEKGMHLGATLRPDGTYWAYRWIAVWHCEISDAWRKGPGSHVDFIRIYGGGERQDVPTTVLLQDIDIHDGDALPIIIQDGTFDKITLRDIRIRNTTVGVQIVAINAGRIGTVVVENCPNISVAIMGRPGSIGTVYVRNSPGIRIGDVLNKNGMSGARIIRQ